MFKKMSFMLLLIAFCMPGNAQVPPAQYVSDDQGIPLQELSRIALSRNKDLEAARESIHQAEARLKQAGLRPNPSLDISGTTDAMFANEGENAYSITFSQPLELGGKRSKRIRVEETAIAVKKAEIADAERQLLGRLRSLYVDATGAASRVELFDRLDRLNQEMVQIMNTRERAGDASRLDSRLLAAETNQVQAQKLAAMNRLAGIMQQIRTLAGFSQTEPLLLKRQKREEIHGTEETLISRALGSRPDLTAARLREELAVAGITLAKSQAVPNLTGFVRYGRESTSVFPPAGQRVAFEPDSVMEFGISIPLPLFNREQGNIAEATSKRTQARSEREALELAIRRDVILAYRRYETAQRTLDILRTGVLQPSQESIKIVQLAYSLGEMRFLDVVNQQRTTVEAETNYVDAQIEFDSAIADLELATGSMAP